TPGPGMGASSPPSSRPTWQGTPPPRRAMSVRTAASCSSLVVLVMAAPPEPRLVAPPGRAVEPLVHAPQAVHPALVRGVGVVHHPILQHDRAHTGHFLPVRRTVCSNAPRALGDAWVVLSTP